ncbi:MAG: filamentous hemagglutinin N-terminal domain-containing protein, partial [Desulfobacterales bacterium]|nr:filamentous hemagglutinin N-terminal domain-containing protein [Desulfobacterales bacterium]
MINFSRLLVAVCFFVVAAGPVHGQVILDGTMGAAGELSGPEYDIKADYGRTAGANLFHGFSTFNVNTAEKATFSGPAHVQNIISRVSGGEASSIDGTIQSTIPGANLYLLNPAGVMFGENASLDLTGSFHVSSGDYLLMGENDRFYTTPRPGEVLSASAPTAFGFLGDSAGPITLHGKGKIEGGEAGPPGLVVQEGQTISLIGGDIEIKGTFTEEINGDGAVSITPFGKSLVAKAGRVHIASVASAGEVTPTSAGLDVTASTRGEISISDGAIIDVSGVGSGSVFIRGGKFFLGNGSEMLADATGAQNGGVTDILADEVALHNSEIFSDATGSGNGGDITINGVESVSITESRVYSDATGENSNAGNVSISTKRLTVVEGQVSSEAVGEGAGGEILLRASESIDITGDGSQIIGRASGETEDAGNAGTITIHTKSLSLTDRAKI